MELVRLVNGTLLHLYIILQTRIPRNLSDKY
jgi:hypothetical protein